MIKKLGDTSKADKFVKEYDKLNEKQDDLERNLDNLYRRTADCYEWRAVKFSKLNKLLRTIDREFKKLVIAERAINKLHKKLIA